MRFIAIFFSICCATNSWAGQSIQPLFHNDYINMTYPSVSGGYLVYSQRVKHRHQIIQLHIKDFNQPAKDVSPLFDKDVVRNGIAFANGDIGYASNRLGHISPWLKQEHGQAMLRPALFQTSLQPNHLNSNADGSTWVFDSTFLGMRRLRIAEQFSNGHLNSQLLGQAWRMYHERFWKYKSSYSRSETGTKNKFKAPHLYVWQKQDQQLTMFGDGFDADVSDDGKQIVFVREDNGNFDLWLQNTDGSGLKRLTSSKYADLEPSFSADGKHIAFVSNRDSRGDVTQTFIHTLDLTTGSIKTLTSGMGVIDGGPAWLDDNTIIFHSNRDYKSPQRNTSEHWSLWTVHIAP